MVAVSPAARLLRRIACGDAALSISPAAMLLRRIACGDAALSAVEA
jgi:hypothetical protein